MRVAGRRGGGEGRVDNGSEGIGRRVAEEEKKGGQERVSGRSYKLPSLIIRLPIRWRVGGRREVGGAKGREKEREGKGRWCGNEIIESPGKVSLLPVIEMPRKESSAYVCTNSGKRGSR